MRLARLQKANAVLVALEYILNEEEIEPIIAADAASVVRELVGHAIEGLDAVSLARGEAKPPATEESATGAGTTEDENEDDGPDTDEDDED